VLPALFLTHGLVPIVIMDEDIVNNLFSIFEVLPSDFEEEYGDLFDTEMEPSLENAIRLNMAYQSVLMIYGQQLQARHRNNQNDQNVLRAEIEVLEYKDNFYKHHKTKLIPFSYFGMLYFKHPENLTNAPTNADTLFAQKIGFLNFSLLLLYKQSKLR
jgi:hypothetical protein